MKRFYISAALAMWFTIGQSACAQNPDVVSLYGHRAHKEAEESQLRPVGKYRDTERIVMLLHPAVEAFIEMQKEAQKEGIEIIPISGYRSLAYQKGLFQRAVGKYGNEEQAARWVAPPGHSEHHTGLAVDVGDKAYPKYDVESCFEKTRAYDWLTKNAGRFGYELSFPPKGTKVSFEPWHWRFVAH